MPRQLSGTSLQDKHYAQAALMNQERQNAYYQLIAALLTCASGEEHEILNAHPDLLDDGLVRAIAIEAERLAQRGDENGANRLRNLEAQLATTIANSSSTPLTEAEANRLYNQGNQQFQRSQFSEALQSWQQALKIYREIGNRSGEADSLNSLVKATAQ